MREGLPLPEKIKNAPEVETGLDLYIQGFFDLNTSRTIGMEEGPIPWSAIDGYCNSLELEDDQREDMFFFIRKLDSAYLDYFRSKQPTSTGK